jgi:hypothetical protein
MIVRFASGEFLADRSFLAAHYQLSTATIRTKLQTRYLTDAAYHAQIIGDIQRAFEPYVADSEAL